MPTVNITESTVFEFETPDGTPIECRYNGSLTINVYIVDVQGRRHEADVITLMEPGVDRARAAIARRLQDHYEGD